MPHLRNHFNSRPRNRGLVIVGSLALSLGLAATSLAQSSGPNSQLQIAVPSVVSRSMPLGHMSGSYPVHVNVAFKVPNPVAFEAFVDKVSDPDSPMYRRFISPKEIGYTFGAGAADVQRTVDYLKANGFKITLVADNRLNVMADGTVAQAEKAFNTTINGYRTLYPNEITRTEYYSFDTPPSVPSAIAKSIQTVRGLDNSMKPKPKALTPDQARVLYNLAPMFNNKVQGQGRNTAINNFDGFQLTNVPLYYAHFSLPTPQGGVGSNITVVTIDGGSQGNSPGGEGDLDIQMVLGMAPLSNFTIYDGGDVMDVFTREANDNLVDVISESYGFALDSGSMIAAHNLTLSMSAEGITFCSASGDSGTSIEPFPYPNIDPEILEVGGTIATVDTLGNRISEIGWNGSGSGWVTEGVPFNVLPTYQKGHGVPTNINFRLFPDVALHAAADSGAYQFYYMGAINSGSIGTSFASPVFAGSLAVTEQQAISLGNLPPDKQGHRRLGRVADLFYKQNGRPDVWFDVTSGDSGQLPNGQEAVAGVGWDFVTGWGPPDFTVLAHTLNTVKPVNFAPTAVKLTEGQNATGNVGSLANVDGNLYTTESGYLPGYGQYAGEQVNFVLGGNASAYATVSISWTCSGPFAATTQVFAYNYTTKAYDVIKAQAMFGTMKTFTAPIGSYSNYINPSTFAMQFVVRGFIQARLEPTPFPFAVDQVQVQATKSQ